MAVESDGRSRARRLALGATLLVGGSGCIAVNQSYSPPIDTTGATSEAATSPDSDGSTSSTPTAGATSGSSTPSTEGMTSSGVATSTSAVTTAGTILPTDSTSAISMSGPASTTSGGSSGQMCDAPCDEPSALCQDYKSGNICIDGCEVEFSCNVPQVCFEMDGNDAECLNLAPGCYMHAADYAQLMITGGMCDVDDDCKPIAGDCSFPGGRCWHAVPNDVNQEDVDAIAFEWYEASCPSKNCDCDGVMEPAVTCAFGKCAIVP